MVMGKEHFCLQCEHIWFSLHGDHCPKCGGEDVSTDDGFNENDGHFEGSFSQGDE